MDESGLVSLLSVALENSSPISQTPQIINPSINPSYLRLAMQFLQSSHPNVRPSDVETINEFVKGEPDLKMFDNQMQYKGGGSASLTTIEGLTSWLITRAQNVGAERAVRDLTRYLAATTFACSQYLAVRGVTVKQRHALAEDVWLVPFDDVPDCWAKSTLMPEPFSAPFGIAPTAALTRVVTESKLHWDSESGPMPMRAGPSVEPLLDASRILGVATAAAPLELAQFTLPDASIPSMTQSGMSYFEAPSGWFHKAPELGADECEEARSLGQAFASLPPSLKDKLRTPMVRLNSAKRRRNAADAAADLGIALESLFLSQNEADEITFKLSTRASKFLDEKLNDRKATARLFTALYGIRSSAVHRGVVDAQIPKRQQRSVDKQYWSTNTLLEYGYRRTGEVITRIIRRGSFPDWESVVLA